MNTSGVPSFDSPKYLAANIEIFKKFLNDVIMTGSDSTPPIPVWSHSVVEYWLIWADNKIVRVSLMVFSKFNSELSDCDYPFSSAHQLSFELSIFGKNFPTTIRLSTNDTIGTRFLWNSLVIDCFLRHRNQNSRQLPLYNSIPGCYSSCNHQYNQYDKGKNRCILRNSDCKSSHNQNLFHMQENKIRIQFRILSRIFRPVENLLKICYPLNVNCKTYGHDESDKISVSDKAKCAKIAIKIINRFFKSLPLSYLWNEG